MDDEEEYDYEQTSLTEEESQAAKDELESAIRAYHDKVTPNSYLDEWILISHKRSVELEQEGTSAVGVLVPTGQSWIIRRGLLEVALEAERDHMWG